MAHKWLFVISGAFCAILAVLSSLLFVGLANEEVCDDSIVGITVSCSPSGVGYCALIAILFYAAASVTIFVMNCKGGLLPRQQVPASASPDKSITSGAPRSIKIDDPTMSADTEEAGVVSTITEENLDGTVKQTTVKTTIAPDGTKHVERTIKMLASAPDMEV